MTSSATSVQRQCSVCDGECSVLCIIARFQAPTRLLLGRLATTSISNIVSPGGSQSTGPNDPHPFRRQHKFTGALHRLSPKCRISNWCCTSGLGIRGTAPPGRPRCSSAPNRGDHAQCIHELKLSVWHRNVHLCSLQTSR